jgi:hypothetical protein
MAFTIFYSWQLKTEAKFNKYFIEDCLKTTIKQVKKELKDESPDFYINRDTKNVAGQPNIPMTIEEKIKNCDVLVGGVTFVSYVDTKEPNGNWSLGDNRTIIDCSK